MLRLSNNYVHAPDDDHSGQKKFTANPMNIVWPESVEIEIRFFTYFECQIFEHKRTIIEMKSTLFIHKGTYVGTGSFEPSMPTSYSYVLQRA